MTVQALNAKLNNRSQFKIEEAVKISNILQIEEPGEIFFDNYIPKMQRN